jgi:hypothetical protein
MQQSTELKVKVALYFSSCAVITVAPITPATMMEARIKARRKTDIAVILSIPGPGKWSR